MKMARFHVSVVGFLGIVQLSELLIWGIQIEGLSGER
jgi:hypothetical protein